MARMDYLITNLLFVFWAELKSQLQTERCRSDRLMETFASVSSELREACALLFGYNLHVRQSGIYKVQLRPSLLSSTSASASTTSAPFIKFKVGYLGMSLRPLLLSHVCSVIVSSYSASFRLLPPSCLVRGVAT